MSHTDTIRKTETDVSVRIRYCDTSEVVGTGLLLKEGYIITCAHVVNTALLLENENDSRNKEGEIIPVSLAYDAENQYQAKVIHWDAPKAEGADRDIAVLRLMDDEIRKSKIKLKSQLNYCALTKHSNPYGLLDKKFNVGGYPTKENERQIWVRGVISGVDIVRHRVQLDKVNTQGYKITCGFSGAPVWSKTGKEGEEESWQWYVVGLIVMADNTSGYMIPVASLYSSWADLKKYITIFDIDKDELLNQHLVAQHYSYPVTHEDVAILKNRIEQINLSEEFIGDFLTRCLNHVELNRFDVSLSGITKLHHLIELLAQGNVQKFLTAITLLYEMLKQKGLGIYADMLYEWLRRIRKKSDFSEDILQDIRHKVTSWLNESSISTVYIKIEKSVEGDKKYKVCAWYRVRALYCTGINKLDLAEHNYFKPLDHSDRTISFHELNNYIETQAGSMMSNTIELFIPQDLMDNVLISPELETECNIVLRCLERNYWSGYNIKDLENENSANDKQNNKISLEIIRYIKQRLKWQNEWRNFNAKIEAKLQYKHIMWACQSEEFVRRIKGKLANETKSECVFATTKYLQVQKQVLMQEIAEAGTCIILWYRQDLPESEFLTQKALEELICSAYTAKDIAIRLRQQKYNAFHDDAKKAYTHLVLMVENPYAIPKDIYPEVIAKFKVYPQLLGR